MGESTGDPSGIDVSVVIPAYNEAQRLPESLTKLRSYLARHECSHEVIVVDDGSTDDTAQIVADWHARWPAVRLLRCAHLGKGGAVRAGMLAARGTFIALADADFSMPAEEFDRFTVTALGDDDIAIGSREAPGARRIGEPAYRHIMGRVFNAVVRLLLLPGIQDSQCGFKCLHRAVATELCARQTVTGWGFDAELLYIARLRGYRVREVPITWYYMPGSQVHAVRDTLTMLRDVLTIRLNGLRGRYPPRPLATRPDVAPVREPIPTKLPPRAR